MKSKLLGKRFGRLTVLSQSSRDKHGSVIWECKCDCGNITFAVSHDLNSGHKKSCGCLKHTSNAKDLKGQKFGYLTVSKRVGTSKDRKALWKCKCLCGKTTIVRSCDLTSGNTKSCGCLGREYAKRNLMKGVLYE